jgi:threonine/homoserine/homoserine lactone efflux protein
LWLLACGGGGGSSACFKGNPIMAFSFLLLLVAQFLLLVACTSIVNAQSSNATVSTNSSLSNRLSPNFFFGRLFRCGFICSRVNMFCLVFVLAATVVVIVVEEVVAVSIIVFLRLVMIICEEDDQSLGRLSMIRKVAASTRQQPVEHQ